MTYEWDDAKRTANIAKHGLDFRDVAHGFDWDSAIMLEPEVVGGEVRQRDLGRLGEPLVLLVWTERGEKVRLISLRVATRREKRFYVENS